MVDFLPKKGKKNLLKFQKKKYLAYGLESPNFDEKFEILMQLLPSKLPTILWRIYNPFACMPLQYLPSIMSLNAMK